MKYGKNFVRPDSSHLNLHSFLVLLYYSKWLLAYHMLFYHPIRSETKTNSRLLAHIFLCFVSDTCSVLIFDWFTRLSVLSVIFQSCNLGFGCTTLSWKLVKPVSLYITYITLMVYQMNFTKPWFISLVWWSPAKIPMLMVILNKPDLYATGA